MDVGTWLRALGLSQYARAFAENDIDSEALGELTADDLKELGVASLGHRKKLLAAISHAPASGVQPVPPQPPPSVPPGELRQVTVLFADLSGFTKLSNERDPEEIHDLLARFFEAVDGVIERYGGTIDKHIGDNVMAVFGAPVAHGNDPERAVRAACDIHEAMGKLGDQLEPPLQAHIGIASGQVMASGTGSARHQEYTVTGESVNLASRLDDIAEPEETLISEAVYRAVADLVEVEEAGEVTVAALAKPVPPWRLRALKGGKSTETRGLFVGRQAELGQFTGVIEACRETGSGKAIYIRGEAGIGKTRLVMEFQSLAKDRGFAVHTGLVLDFGVGKGQHAIGALTRGFLGIPQDSGKAIRRAHADKGLADGLVSPDQLAYLNDLLDLPQPTELRSIYDAMDPATRNRGKQATVAGLLNGIAGRQPVLVAVENVHWASALILDHLAAMTSAVTECRAVLVVTSRVEGDPLDQAWRSRTRGSGLMTIDLAPLREDEAMALAGAFIDATFHIPESPSPASQLTARFVNVPVAHMMENLTVELHFSENIPGLSYLTMKDHAFETTSGEIGGARRIEKGKNQKWLITVSPQGPEDVSITLRPSPDCQSEHAICSASDESLASAVQTTVRGPATLSVASARAHESDDETIDFVVSLDRNALKTITVDYATRDGSAKAGEDYTATSGTLTFTVGQRSKTVQVPLLDDAKDEGEETFEFILSNASGALVGNTTATGTIENDDPLQRAWLARFGRTVGSQAVDAIGERVTGDAPTHVTIAGQSLGAAPDGDALAEIEANARAEAMAQWLRGEKEEDERTRALTGRELLLGSAFSLSAGGERGAPRRGAWGRFATGRFDGQEDGVTLSGEVTSAFLGADVGSGRWLRRRKIILDMDSSVSPTYGDQEGTAYNGHFGCTCYHPLFLFNQFGDLERCRLRPGNVHSADGWRDVLEPVVERYKATKVRLYLTPWRPENSSTYRLQVLWADLVVDALVGALEHTPKRFDAVGVSHPVNVLTNAVLDGFVLERHALVGGCVVCVDGCAPGSVVGDEFL